jgi:hypothetical protein
LPESSTYLLEGIDSPVHTSSVKHVGSDECTSLGSLLVQLSNTIRDTIRTRDLGPDECSFNLMLVDENPLDIVIIDLSLVALRRRLTSSLDNIVSLI